MAMFLLSVLCHYAAAAPQGQKTKGGWDMAWYDLDESAIFISFMIMTRMAKQMNRIVGCKNLQTNTWRLELGMLVLTITRS